MSSTVTTWRLQLSRPNPFNSGTLIAYDVVDPGPVLIKVYDLLGREVTTLVDGYRQNGRYQTRWNGRDAAGNSVSSGVYLHRMTAGGRVMSRKFIYLR